MKKIGKYEIIGRLGVGSMGVIYKAVDPALGRHVAIKTIRGFKNSPELLERFKMEARSAGSLKHQNIITIYDVEIDTDEPYMAMDYVDGVSLESVLNAIGGLDVDLAIYYAEQIANALDAVHEQGVLHKDLKPANIMVSNNHHLYVLDFGVATITHAGVRETEAEDTEEVSEDDIMGTPGYMSPEQIKNEDLDYRTDLFSFAVVLFEMLVGHKPFSGKTYKEVFDNIVKKEPRSVTMYKNYPITLDAVFYQALSKDKTKRYKNANEFVAAIKEALKIDKVTIPSEPLRTLSSAIRRQTREITSLTPEEAAEMDLDQFSEFLAQEDDPPSASDLYRTASWKTVIIGIYRKPKIALLVFLCAILLAGILSLLIF